MIGLSAPMHGVGSTNPFFQGFDSLNNTGPIHLWVDDIYWFSRITSLIPVELTKLSTGVSLSSHIMKFFHKNAISFFLSQSGVISPYIKIETTRTNNFFLTDDC